jgi:mannose-1-phosphate guanylyltransferase / mannose-6-phosphate isomerase
MRVAGKSLLRRAVARASAMPGVSQCAVVTNVGYVHQRNDELTTSSAASVSRLLEPRPQDTAPAIAVAALWVAANFGKDESMLVLPADHLIEREDEFAQAAVAADEMARTARQLVMPWQS